MDYLSKWADAIPTRTNEFKVVVRFLRENNFANYRILRAIVTDQRTHFDNRTFDALLKRYSILHCLATPYHPQPNGQLEVSNRQIKQIPEKTVNKNREDWADKLIDVLWPYCMAFKIA